MRQGELFPNGGLPLVRFFAFPRLTVVLSVLPAALVPLLAVPVATHPGGKAHPVSARVSEVSVGLAGAPVRGARTPLGTTGQLATNGFKMLGVSWQPDAHGAPLDVEVRTRHDGHWSLWHALDADAEDRPDPADFTEMAAHGGRLGTAPLWVGDADGVQARVIATGAGRAPHGVRVSLIDPGTSAADHDFDQPSASAEAMASKPTIISRKAWGANESYMKWSHDYSKTIKVAFLHHTDTTNAYYSKAEAMAQVRGVYHYHAVSLGWGDIGYNFLVDRFGNTYEGRSGGVDSTVIGGHTYGFNRDTTGIALLGTHTTKAPSTKQLTAVEKVMAWKLGRYFRNPLGKETLTAGANNGKYAEGSKHTFNTISGHRDGYSTACPGNAAYAKLGAIRRAADTYLNARLVSPTATVVKDSSHPNGAVVVRAGLRGTESWKLVIKDKGTGVVLRTLSGKSTGSMAATWDLIAGQAFVVPGTYLLTLSASDSSGRSAQPADLTVTISTSSSVKPQWPAGTVLKVGTSYYSVGLYKGKPARRVFLSPAALATFPGAKSRAVTVTPTALGTLPSGGNQVYRDGTLVKGATGDTYVISLGQRRSITAVASTLYAGKAPITVPDAELAKVPVGSAVAGAVHPAGSYVQASDGATYAIVADANGVLYRRPLTSPVAVTSQVPPELVLPASAADEALPLDGYVRGLADGTVFTTGTASTVYVISLGLARPVTDAARAQLGLTTPVLRSMSDVGHAADQPPAIGTTVGSTGTTLTVRATAPGLGAVSKGWAARLPGTTPAAVASRSPSAP